MNIIGTLCVVVISGLIIITCDIIIIILINVIVFVLNSFCDIPSDPSLIQLENEIQVMFIKNSNTIFKGVELFFETCKWIPIVVYFCRKIVSYGSHMRSC